MTPEAPTRIRIVAGPWPERIGSEGIVLNPPPGPAGARYPWAGRTRTEIIVLLDNDPLHCEKNGCDHSNKQILSCTHNRGWTCAIQKQHVEVIT